MTWHETWQSYGLNHKCNAHACDEKSLKTNRAYNVAVSNYVNQIKNSYQLKKETASDGIKRDCSNILLKFCKMEFSEICYEGKKFSGNVIPKYLLSQLVEWRSKNVLYCIFLLGESESIELVFFIINFYLLL